MPAKIFISFQLNPELEADIKEKILYEIEHRNTEQYQVLEDRIFSFRSLKADWDSYNADIISENVIILGLKVLDSLKRWRILDSLGGPSHIEVNVFPMRDGGIQFEFDGENLCAELEITPEGTLQFSLFDEEGNVVQVSTLSDTDMEELRNHLLATEYA